MTYPSRFNDRFWAASRGQILVGGIALAIALSLAGRVTSSGLVADPVAPLRQQFNDAGRAYGEGRMPEAIRLYEGLISAGHPTVEIYYNLGNAYFKSGQFGLAVLNYRRAWQFAPRDTDIGSSMRSSLDAAGAAEAELSGVEIVFTKISEKEWVIVALSAWWTTCLLFTLIIISRNRLKFLVTFAVAAGFVVVAALVGIWTWRGFERNPELVVIGEARNARSAPQVSAAPSFQLPEGSILRARTRRGEWFEVSSGQLTGWIDQAACAMVIPNIPPK